MSNAYKSVRSLLLTADTVKHLMMLLKMLDATNYSLQTLKHHYTIYLTQRLTSGNDSPGRRKREMANRWKN